MRCKTTVPFAIAVLLCSLLSGIVRADQVTFTLNDNSAKLNVFDFDVDDGVLIDVDKVRTVWRDYENPDAVDMNVLADGANFEKRVVKGYYGTYSEYVYEITETITNNAGVWGDFKWILNPDLATLPDGMSIRATTVLGGNTGLEYGEQTNQLIQIVGSGDDGLIPFGAEIEMKYEIVFESDYAPTAAVDFTVRGVDVLRAVPTPSASIALVGLFGSLLLFGVRRNRRAAQDN